MRISRRNALALLVVITGGSLMVTGGYAWYLRSALYRNSCATTLSESLGLPAEIGQVVPRSWSTREFRNVRIWLPERRDEAAFIERALVLQTPTDDDPNAWEVQLNDGRCEISTRTWLREDYRFLLESGLRPGFDPNGPQRAVFNGLDLEFERGQFQAALNDARGVVVFESSRVGRAAVTCNEFNGYYAPQPVVLNAVFSPQLSGIQLDRVDLIVPRLPLAIVGLDGLAAVSLQTGAFDGRMTYRERDARREVRVAGHVFDVQLSEATAGFFPMPCRGVAPELELGELVVRDGVPQKLEFRGTLIDVVLGDLLAPLSMAGVGGELTLRVRAANVSPEGVDRFIASGRCDNVDLERVSEAFGWGRVTGRANLKIDDLTIRANQLTAADVHLSVQRSDDNWVERRLLSELAQRTLGFTLPAWLPERFPYAELGVRFEVRDELLYVFGTHGPEQKTLLTVQVAGQDIGLIREPEEPFDLRATCAELRGRALAFLGERFPRIEELPDAVDEQAAAADEE